MIESRRCPRFEASRAKP